MTRSTPDDWTDDLFRAELAPIVSRHMRAAMGDPKKLAGVYEVLAHMLGNAVAQGCEGNQKMMGLMLEGIGQHLIEVAAERQPLMELLGQLKRNSLT